MGAGGLMARFKVTHSEDACCIDIRGDIRNPEPSTAVVRFPGGHIEVSRHSDGSYWVHFGRNARLSDPDDVPGRIVDSRVDFVHAAGLQVEALQGAQDIEHFAVRVARG